MSTQLSANSESTASPLRAFVLAAALLAALGPSAAADAASLPDLLPGDSGVASELGWSQGEVTVSGVEFAKFHSYQLDFGTAGLTVTGPLAAGDGDRRGLVLSWTVTARDPAYLVTVSSLLSNGLSSGGWVAGEILRTLPDLGVVPNGNLSVFDTGVVDAISWDFLEFSCAMLALRLEDYLRLDYALGPAELDLAANASIADGLLEQRPVPEPATPLLLGQGILVLALLGPRRLRPRCARCAGG